MKDRKGDWRDLLASHSLAIELKKLWLGFVAAVASIALLAIVALIYGWWFPSSKIGVVGQLWRADNLITSLLQGRGLANLRVLLPLFNPFRGGVAHLALSALLYFILLAVFTYCGGAITRIVALQYAKDDIPTLQDGLKMVRAKRRAYLFAPLTPLFGILAFGVANIVVGLIGSIPVVGPWLMVVLVPLCSVPGTVVMTFVAVLGVVSFGLMLPAVSIGGKDAFEGWSSAYSYLLWGFNRFVCYTLLAAVIGLLTTLVAFGITELFVYLLVKTVSMGIIGGTLVHYVGGSGHAADVLPVTGGSVGMAVVSWVTVVIAFIARCLVPAYAISYFFTANTIICFLLRKHVDRIEVDQVYEEKPEEEAPAEEEETGEEGPEAEAPAAGPAEESAEGQPEGGEAGTEHTETGEEDEQQ